MALLRILVDGYSPLPNRPELAPGKQRHPAAARNESIQILTRYHDATGTPMTGLFAWVFGLAVIFLVLVVFGGAPWGGSVSGQTNLTSRLPSTRWLFIVQTSASMQRRSEAIQQIAGAMLVAGMNGQMRRGDTLGVWTFNEDLYTGLFPLQEWTPGTSAAIALQVVEFLKSRKYEKGRRFDVFLPGMERVIKDSDFITVVLISDGREKIHHTPFDSQINAVYQAWQLEQERAKMPFVTVLRAQRGRITDYAVTVPPWPLQLPPLPTELLPRKAKEAKTAQPPSPSAPPLIISGKESEPPPAAPVVLNALSPASMATNATASHALVVTPALAPETANPATETGATPPMPVPNAATEPQKPSPHPGHAWVLALGIAGLILAGVALVIVLLLLRRASPSVRVSLPSHSPDREQK
jgi:hypothetical protein